MFTRHQFGCRILRAVAVSCLLTSSALLHAQIPDFDFEIVESVPIETLLDNPDIRNTGTVWREMIQQARYTIDLEHFYMSNEPHSALDTILQALRQAVQSGVKLRVILDARMSQTYPQSVVELNKMGATVHLTQKFNQLGGVQHAKFMVIDTQMVFLGSQNLDWRALTHIHELGFRIKQRQLAEQFLSLFESDWNDANEQTNPPAYSTTIPKVYHQQLPSQESITFWTSASPIGKLPAGFQWDEASLLGIINSARKSICVQLLSYSTNDKEGRYNKLDDALRQAAARGVQVRLIIADWATASQEITNLQALARLDNIQIRLTTIPEFSGGYIPYARVEHCKFCVVDDSLSWLGTANWGKSYFYNSRNLSLIVANPTISRRLSKIFWKSWESPYAWDLSPHKVYPKKFYRDKNQ
jgi:HKD family nuclease